MADFYQHALLPTLHHLSTPDSTAREAELSDLAQERPIVLLLPALHQEVERPALPAILSQISEVPYISEVVLSMNGMDEAQMQQAKSLCREWVGEKKLTLLWNDGPALKLANRQFDEAGALGGKGANIWMGLAYLKAAGHKGIIVSHDTDILGYKRDLLAKLSYPIAHPRLGYRYVKGYYSRVADRLYGRVTRLLIFPLIQAFQEVLGPMPLLDHLESFRYPLSGEFAGDCTTLASFEIPSAWGLEIAMLCEAQRQLKVSEMCQVEPGLVHAAADVARCLAHQILRHAQERSAEHLLKVVLEHYRQRSLEWMDRYEHVALLNGLHYDRAEEAMAVSAFTEALEALTHSVGTEGLHSPAMRPSPAKALEANPELAQQILAAAL
jgi:glucosyl-3-phosphoglycerate synthase